ncbi:hypothetical protein FHR92_000369 [Fontibacillus solani]|uniref:Uncharacterized protein n=1 Tax=Fontibacillus solani TaxID=1572857 RepID=A0A7W3SPP0_9BACL|nr:hypothetical protein [Fontibacillus solani]MBA9083926.1 hypothetical protein [Fontibacillus solani]
MSRGSVIDLRGNFLYDEYKIIEMKLTEIIYITLVRAFRWCM